MEIWHHTKSYMEYIGEHLCNSPQNWVAQTNQVVGSFVQDLELVEEDSSFRVWANKTYAALLSIYH